MQTTRLPPLKSLKAFEAAARHESFLEAASEQHVTSGAISRHVRLLERHLGIELFVRRSNGVTLTSAGKEYAERISSIFRDLRIATDHLHESTRKQAIVISSSPIFSERWLFPRIPSFRNTFGLVELQVEYHNGQHDANREDVDAWIMYSNGHHPGYSVTRLFGERICPVCSPEFRKTLSANPSVREVIRQPMLHDMYWHRDWPVWLDAVGATAGEFSSSMRFGLYNGVIQAAVDGLGIAIGHSVMIAKELAAGKLVPLSHLSVDSPKSYHLVMNASASSNPTCAKLKEWFLMECANGNLSNS